MIWKLFYNILIVPALWLAFRFYAAINTKAKRSWNGREGLFERLDKGLSRISDSEKRIWFHASSMGEFEQAKPIIAGLKQKHPSVRVIVSFFSSSGYEHSLSYKLADVITYIPFDSAKNASKFIEMIKPFGAVFMRYDLWPNHLWELNKRRIPAYLASATFHRKKYREIPVIKNFLRALYNSVDYILTVSSVDRENFIEFKISRPIIKEIGDTRYDQVWQRSADSRRKQLLDSKITADKKIIVIGSSWREDDIHLLTAVNRLLLENTKLLIIWVPHEPTEENLDYLEKEFNGKVSSIRFSHLHNYNGESIIVVDSVGVLMPLYQYANVAYVGGGFSSGIHNVLEPAVYGIPVIFGPRHENSQEAKFLISSTGGKSVHSSEEIYQVFYMLIREDKKRLSMGRNALALVENNIGATELFMKYLKI
ncbi:MAG: 3-deoxy-D-manno-octulosonic acid transferase [Ignavibacteriales bacterium]|nr:3-deoxy-D-manno-octulosonic acid transferase [Ignavibacteriales bacterium]